MKRSAPLRRKTRLRPRRKTPRKSGRVRDREHLLAVKQLPCCVDQQRWTVLSPAWACDGRVEADHAGRRPLGRKADDDTAIPMCRQHHRMRTDYAGPFSGWNDQHMRAWCDARIAETRAAVALLRSLSDSLPRDAAHIAAPAPSKRPGPSQETSRAQPEGGEFAGSGPQGELRFDAETPRPAAPISPLGSERR